MAHPFDGLDGLKRGAQKFGTRGAAKDVRKAELRNGFAPQEPEPYGLGMGGADGEQESQAPSQALNADESPRLKELADKIAAARKKLFPGDAKDAPARKELEALQAQYEALEKELKNAGNEPGAGNKPYCDACDRAEADCVCLENAASKCPGCGHESAEAWSGKCEACGLECPEGAGANGGALLARLRGDEKQNSSDELWRQKGRDWSLSLPTADANLLKYNERYELLPLAQQPDGVKRIFEASFGEKKNAGEVHFTFGSGTERQAACGAAVAFGDKHVPLKDVTCKACLEELSGKKQNAAEKQNAGHVGPESWAPADLNERIHWLELAGQDINLAPCEWADLSMDTHKALQDAKDMPSSRNNSGDDEAKARWDLWGQHGTRSLALARSGYGKDRPMDTVEQRKAWHAEMTKLEATDFAQLPEEAKAVVRKEARNAVENAAERTMPCPECESKDVQHTGNFGFKCNKCGHAYVDTVYREKAEREHAAGEPRIRSWYFGQGSNWGYVDAEDKAEALEKAKARLKEERELTSEPIHVELKEQRNASESPADLCDRCPHKRGSHGGSTCGACAAGSRGAAASHQFVLKGSPEGAHGRGETAENAMECTCRGGATGHMDGCAMKNADPKADHVARIKQDIADARAGLKLWVDVKGQGRLTLTKEQAEKMDPSQIMSVTVAQGENQNEHKPREHKCAACGHVGPELDFVLPADNDPKKTFCRGCDAERQNAAKYSCDICKRQLDADSWWMCDDCDKTLCEDCADDMTVHGLILCPDDTKKRRAPKKNSSKGFRFTDRTGAVETVEARDGAHAWQVLSARLNATETEMKDAGIKLDEAENASGDKAKHKADRDALKGQLDRLTAELHQIEGQDGAHSHDDEPAVKKILARMQEVERAMEAAHQDYLDAHERDNTGPTPLEVAASICKTDGKTRKQAVEMLLKAWPHEDRGAIEAAVDKYHSVENSDAAADVEQIEALAEGILHEAEEIEQEQGLENGLLTREQFIEAWDAQSAQFRRARCQNVGLPNFADATWAELPEDVKERLLAGNEKNFANSDGDECPECHGEGEVDAPKGGEKMPASGKEECPKCGGLGRLENAEDKEIDFECVACRKKFKTGQRYSDFNPATDYPKCPACGGHDILDNKKISEGEVGKEIEHHIKDKGMDPDQAVAAAFSETRNQGVARGASKYGAKK